MHRQFEHGVIWRVIDTGPCCGRENMAIDEALFRCFDPSSSRPVLRLYGWQPPALSLGRFQKAEDDLDLDRCKADNLDVVRRITGGGAIYHADELTYSLVCSTRHMPLASSVKDSFRLITSFLLDFYRYLGLKADYAVDMMPVGSRLGERTPLCFAGKESYDIVINGRKIGGNAQRRTRNLIFQHGSVPILNRFEDGVGYMLKRPEGIDRGATSLADEGVSVASVSELRSLLADCFARRTGSILDPGLPTTEESATAGRLMHEKYRNDGWNLEGVQP